MRSFAKKSIGLLSTLLILTLMSCQSAAPESQNDSVEPETAVEVTETVSPSPIPPTAVVEIDAPPAPTAQPTDIPAVDPSPTEIPPTALPLNGQPAESFNLELIADGFFKPLGVEHAGDERLFVVQQTGLISIVDNGQVIETPFLDIVERVNSNANEQGLLGLAFHPAYLNNGRFFLNYSDGDGATVIAEFRVSDSDPNQANPSSERILLTIPQPYSNHNGGQIRFGPDGYLYIGMGDGGSQDDPQNNGQNFAALLGSMLRIDVDGGPPYGIPATNPFVNDDNVPGEIWAKGLRNPWRFAFDRQTGDLFISDVGQFVYEEINFQPAGSPGGENYGWKIYEGFNCYLGDCNTPNLTPPIAEYSHADGHCSVTGGYVYRGSEFPEMRGNYFMADYCSGAMWSLFPNEDGSWSQNQIGNAGFLVSSFGEDVNGELYVVSQNEGMIYRLTP